MIIEQLEIEALLRRELTYPEQVAMPLIIEEAKLLIEGYLGESIDEEDTPDAITQVVRRLLVRQLKTPIDLDNVSNVSETTGPFSYSRTFSSSDLYLGRTEKTMLRPFKKGFGVLRQRWY